MTRIMLILSSFIFFIGTPCWATSFEALGVTLNKPVKSFRELRTENVTTQSLDFSCGAAGLSTLLNFYLNDPITEQEIIAELLTIVPLQKVKARHGFSLLDLKAFAEKRGYKVTGYKMDFNFLKGLGKPLLVPIRFKNYRHFVVIKGVIGDRVFIADPAVGNMTVRKEKFMKMWTNGIGFVVEHVEKKENREYALKISENDVKMYDYKSLSRFLMPNQLRTVIHSNEW